MLIEDEINQNSFLTIEVAELLIDHGADLYAKAEYPNEGDSHTPVDIANSPKGKFNERKCENNDVSSISLLITF